MATIEPAPIVHSIGVTAIFSPSARDVVEHELQLQAGITVAGAVALVCLVPGFETLKSIPVERLSTGIWGRKVDGQTRLQSGDRLEIYRPLLVDPKTARRLRFNSQGAKVQSAGLFAKRRDGGKAGY